MRGFLGLILIGGAALTACGGDGGQSGGPPPPPPPAASKLSLLAGDTGGPGAQDGTGGVARFDPSGEAADSAGNIYLADRGNNTIRKITPAGVVTTLAGMAESREAVTEWVRQHASRCLQGRRLTAPVTCTSRMLVTTPSGITPAGVVTTLAGAAGVTGSSDGTGQLPFFLCHTGWPPTPPATSR
jgi:hypothetical protein